MTAENLAGIRVITFRSRIRVNHENHPFTIKYFWEIERSRMREFLRTSHARPAL